MVVDNAENASSTIEAILSSVTDNTGSGAKSFATTPSGEPQTKVYIGVSKTPILLVYDTFYWKTLNNQPWELVRFKDPQNTCFSALHQCVDGGQATDPSCTWVKRNGQNIPYSQGFCCKCDLLKVFGTDASSRSYLDCSGQALLAGTCRYNSAHCLRMDPLYYHGFTIGTPKTLYAIDVVITKCNTATNTCSNETLTIGPDNPGQVSTDKKVLASLIGDFAAQQAPVSFNNKYMFMPAGYASENQCGNGIVNPRTGVDISARCTARQKSTPDEWLFVDKNLVEAGGTVCNKIGVSYDAFRNHQGSTKCEQAVGSCLANQLQDLYQQDLDAIKAGKNGQYMARFQGNLGLDSFIGSKQAQEGGVQAPGSNARVSFITNRFQKTLITLQIAADDIKFTTNVFSGKIYTFGMKNFEQNSNNGLLEITILNTATCAQQQGSTCNAQFTIQLGSCTPTIRVGNAKVLTIAAGEYGTTTFSVVAETPLDAPGANHHCLAELKDAQSNLIDNMTVTFNTTATVIVKPQDGNLSTVGQGLLGDALLTSTFTCSGKCPNVLDVICFFNNGCYLALLVYAAVVAGVLLFITALQKMGFFKAVCKCCPGYCCDDDLDRALREKKKRRAERAKRRAARNERRRRKAKMRAEALAEGEAEGEARDLVPSSSGAAAAAGAAPPGLAMTNMGSPAHSTNDPAKFAQMAFVFFNVTAADDSGVLVNPGQCYSLKGRFWGEGNDWHFGITQEYATQTRTCVGNNGEYAPLPQGNPLDSNYFTFDMGTEEALWYISATPQFEPING